MGLNEADKARFATVLKNVKYDCLASFASTVRHSGHHSTGIINVPVNPRPISCRYLSNINCGSFHVVINVLFADGTMWVLKIPGTGHEEGWDTSSAQSLVSEAQTMRLVRRETSVPVPQVYAFDASVDNEVGCPYILMEMIHGKPLYEVWFDEDVSRNKLEEYRARALQGIAGAMSQLNRLTFGEGGALVFDDKGNFAGVGSSKAVDLEVLYEKLQIEDRATPFYQRKPFKDPKSYFQDILDRRGKKMERSEFDKGVYDLLRLFIDWSLPDSSTFQAKPFVLSHPDFDIQNILVTNDGTLAGIIDWDWVSAVPSYIGCQKYPLFLIKDYDPVNYDYDVKAGKPYEGYDANSPAELSCYRAMYAQFMEACLTKEERANMDKGARQAARVRKARTEAANMTRKSLVIGILELAASAPHLTTRMMTNMFEELGRLTATEWDVESSTTGSEEGCGSDDDDGDGTIDTDVSETEDTSSVAEKHEDAGIEADEVNGSNSVKDKACPDKTQSGPNFEKIETSSKDDLVSEIEKLTALSPSDGLNLDCTAEQACPDTTEIEETLTNFDGQCPNSGTDTVDSLKPRLARACRWAQKKLRRRAEKLHRTDGSKGSKDARKPMLDRACGWAQIKLQHGAERLHHEKMAEEASENPALALENEWVSSSRNVKGTRALCGWTEKQLRRAVEILHCNQGLVCEDDIKSEVDSARKGGLKKLVEWLQRKLKQLLQNLRLKMEAGVDYVAGNKDQFAHSSPALTHPRVLTKDKKREICCKVARMAQNNKVPLIPAHQVAIARWMIQGLQEGLCSDTPSQQDILPVDKGIDETGASSEMNNRGANRSESLIESEVETVEVLFDATEELHSRKVSDSEVTKQDTKAIGVGTLASEIAGVDVTLNLEGKAEDRDEGSDEDDEEGHNDEILTEDYESNNDNEIAIKNDEGAVAQSDEASTQRSSIAPTTETIQNPATDPPATDGEMSYNNERLYPDRPNSSLEDDGSFYMPCVCIALARGNLDERRMQRLKDGFFALLNQTS
ncbi:MAG: hypothetical protein ALECFALPRED_000404 [Alectoria fallacina]|uniref:Aminoglycoside phosphotransferase domain-containing protein n=1 Tax=Alectoria fallacina TaxID=1903189 RepID=A0A8H3PL75_9LECA|nr:MAG: hypothetical protein ALECFALPRED_000404 [Alectoria fallacina]